MEIIVDRFWDQLSLNFGVILDALFQFLLLFVAVVHVLAIVAVAAVVAVVAIVAVVAWLLGCLVAWLLACLVAWLLGCLVACPTSQGTVAGLAEGSWIYINVVWGPGPYIYIYIY